MQPAQDAETSWRVFFRHMQHNPELQAESLDLCCRLCCCSQGLASLVHTSCTGSLQACVPRRPATRPPCASAAWTSEAVQQGKSVGRWLEKHARLLHTLELNIWPEQEFEVAAGLVAAARSGTSITHSLSACTAAAPTTSAHPVPQEPGLLLPLAALVCMSPSNGQLLCAVAGAQLSTLHLRLQLKDAPAAAQQYCAALASLQHLRRLTLIGSWCSAQPLPVLGPALQRLTQLTELLLPCVQLDSRSVGLLPVSLLHLKVCCHSEALQLQRLSSLRSLHLEQQLHINETLPPSLTSVRLGSMAGVRPLLLLPELQWLRVDSNLTAEQLQELSTMTQLQEVQLSYFCPPSKGCEASVLSAAAGQFSRLPLKRLNLMGQLGPAPLPAAVISMLGSWSQLTSLTVHDLTLDLSPQQGEVQQQAGSLQLQHDPGQQAAQEVELHGLQMLVEAVAGLNSLQELSWSGLGTGAAAAASFASRLKAAAPHVTCLLLDQPRENALATAMGACCSLR